MLASLGSFQQLWLSKAEYMEVQPTTFPPLIPRYSPTFPTNTTYLHGVHANVLTFVLTNVRTNALTNALMFLEWEGCTGKEVPIGAGSIPGCHPAANAITITGARFLYHQHRCRCSGGVLECLTSKWKNLLSVH